MENTIENRIAHLLLQKSKSVSELGLCNGKMGIAILLYQYSRDTNCVIYEEQADNLIDEVCEGISSTMPVGFSSGLCGIGWGIEYLIRKGFIQGDSDTILKEIDDCVLSHIHYQQMKSIELSDGICGLARYLISRIIPKKDGGDTSSSIRLKEYLIYLIDWIGDRLDESMEHTEDVLELLLDMHKLDFYNTKVESLIMRCAATEKGIDFFLNIKKDNYGQC